MELRRLADDAVGLNRGDPEDADTALSLECELVVSELPRRVPPTARRQRPARRSPTPVVAKLEPVLTARWGKRIGGGAKILRAALVLLGFAP